jgi:hypothetical protein
VKTDRHIPSQRFEQANDGFSIVCAVCGPIDFVRVRILSRKAKDHAGRHLALHYVRECGTCQNLAPHMCALHRKAANKLHRDTCFAANCAHVITSPTVAR